MRTAIKKAMGLDDLPDFCSLEEFSEVFRVSRSTAYRMAALATGQPEASVEKPSIAPRRAESITVGEWMDRWLEKYAKPTVKLSAYCSYEQLIRSHVSSQIDSRYMSTMTGEDLQDFFNE